MRRRPSWRRRAAPFAQAGTLSVAEAPRATVLHPGAVAFDPVGNALGAEAPRRRA